MGELKNTTWKVVPWKEGEAQGVGEWAHSRCLVVEGRHSCDGSPHSPMQPVCGDGEGAAEVVQEVWENLPDVRDKS